MEGTPRSELTSDRRREILASLRPQKSDTSPDSSENVASFASPPPRVPQQAPSAKTPVAATFFVDDGPSKTPVAAPFFVGKEDFVPQKKSTPVARIFLDLGSHTTDIQVICP